MANPIEGKIADAVIAYAEQNKAQVIEAINAAEGGLEAFLEKAVDSVQVKGVVLPIVWPSVKAALVQELKTLETQNPGSVIFELLDQEAHAFAKSLGG
ncbi:MAG: hypothetical protein KGL39_27265 [Patescibacteria group bacterium]|nr:hypothetical protein [Patescibacteria group bacterium]